MRTPIWEVSAGALAALLNSGVPLTKCDLYTITLPTGAILRWTSGEVARTVNGQLYALGPGIVRTQCTWSIGVSVDTLTITLHTDAARPCSIGGVPLLAYIFNGGFMRAKVQLDRAFWGPNDAGPVGTLNWFTGKVAETPDTDRRYAQLNVKSGMYALNVQVPAEVFQASCPYIVYGPACQASRAAFTSTGAATSVSTVGRTVFNTGLTQATGYFDLGTVTFTSGANAGAQRSVKSQVGGVLTVLSPLPAPVAIGDTFTIVPGCDGQQATCSGKFGNLVHFGGEPYIPQAETIL